MPYLVSFLWMHFRGWYLAVHVPLWKLMQNSTTSAQNFITPVFILPRWKHFISRGRKWKGILSSSPSQPMLPQLLTKHHTWLYLCNTEDLVWFQGFPRNFFPSLNPNRISWSKSGNLWYTCQKQFNGRFQMTHKIGNPPPAHSWRHFNMGKALSVTAFGISF